MDKYSVVQLARGKGGLPAPIWKLRKQNVLILEKKDLIVFIYELNFSFKILFSEFLGEKTANFFLQEILYSVVDKMLIEVPLFQETTLVFKSSWLHPWYLSNINNRDTKEKSVEIALLSFCWFRKGINLLFFEVKYNQTWKEKI